MSPSIMSPSIQRWDTDRYETQHAFVWRYGERLLELLRSQPGERILDLGCGTGQLTAAIASQGATVQGIDASAAMIAAAQQNYPQLAFRVADARNFQVETPLDAVFSNAALHWVLEPDAVIDSVWRSLRPGGRFVAELGGKGNVQQILAGLRHGFEAIGCPVPACPWYFPSLSDYATRLEQRGFEVQYAALFDRPTLLEAGSEGLANWLQMFASGMLMGLTAEQQRQVIQTVEDQLRPALYEGDRWAADYRRLQVVAIKPI
jgi:trans-aconitate methyltransferase